MARSRDLGKLPFELKGGAVKTILSKATNDDYDFVFRNLEAADMPTGIDALNISTGKITNTEFDYLDGVTSNIQGQIDAIKGIKHATASGTDTYTATITGVTSYADGDAYLIRFTNGNTTGCTLNINSLGAKALYRNNDGALIGGDIVDGGEMLCIYNSTLNGFQAIGTAPNTLLAYVTNADSVSITKGMPVYAFGGTGDRMTVKRAYNTGDATSAKTVGLVLSSSIAANQKGLIIIQGLLDGLNILPTSTFADGDTIYLGSTAGTITNVKPYAPNHLVYLGVVTTASNGNAGRMYVRVQNGYELDELHNVQAQTPSTNDVLYYFGGNQWKTASISSVLGYTPGTVSSVAALTLGTSGTDLSSTVANGTTTPVITLNVPTASATNRGVLSSADWSTFNSKESALTFGTGLSRVGNTITNTITQYTDALARLAITDSVTGLDYNSITGVWSTTSGYGIPTTASQTNWDTAYTNRITSLTTTGSSGSATLVSNTLNIPTYTLAGLGGQPLATNLTSLSGLTYASASFVKMTAAGTFSLDTATYLTGNQTITLSGDVSGSGTTAITTTIGANKVTNSMLSQVATATFKGRTTAGTGNVEDLTATQATALLDTFTSSLKGLTPASGGGTTNFLRADGTWAAPSGGGGGTPGGSDTQIQYNSAGSFAGSSNLVWDNTNIRLGIAQSTPTSRFHLNFNQNSVTQSDANGVLLANSTAAIAGTQSISPAIVWQGNGWKTNATAASQDVRFRMDVLPVQGTANPTATWRLLSNINNAGYSNQLSYTSNGVLSLNNVISVAGGTGLINAGTQITCGANSTSTASYKTTNAGATITPLFVSGQFTTLTAGTLSISYDITNQLTFSAANGSAHIARAAIQIVSLTNTAGSETGDLALYTQSGGTAMSEKMRIFAAGNVGINTGSTNGGYKFDVNGTSRIQNVLTTTGRVHANSRKTSAYTLTTLDRIIFADLATGAFTITLPNHVAGTEYTIIKIDSTANLLTVNTTSGLINGSSTWTTLIQYRYITLVSDGTNWLKVSEGN